MPSWHRTLRHLKSLFFNAWTDALFALSVAGIVWGFALNQLRGEQWPAIAIGLLAALVVAEWREWTRVDKRIEGLTQAHRSRRFLRSCRGLGGRRSNLTETQRAPGSSPPYRVRNVCDTPVTVEAKLSWVNADRTPVPRPAINAKWDGHDDDQIRIQPQSVATTPALIHVPLSQRERLEDGCK